MKPSLFFVFAGLAAFARGAERDEEYAFSVQPGCTLKVDSYRGAVLVAEGDAPQITLAVHMEIGADTEAEAERMRAQLQLEVRQAGNIVTVCARKPSETRIRWVWNDDRQIDLTYRITVPRHCDVDVQVINGSITVSSLT